MVPRQIKALELGCIALGQGGNLVSALGSIPGRSVWTHTGKVTYTRVLCQKNEGSVKTKQRPVKMGGRTICRTLSPKRTLFQTGIVR
jgi:hypothetical protein